MPKFELTADYSPTGDQPEAIAQLTEGLFLFSYIIIFTCLSILTCSIFSR